MLSDRRSSTPPCDHPASITTLNAGITRQVCESCGAVRISFDHDYVLESARAEAREEQAS